MRTNDAHLRVSHSPLSCHVDRSLLAQRRFLDRVAREDAARFEKAAALRGKQHQRTRLLMGLNEQWGLEIDLQREKQEAAATALAGKKAREDTKARLKARLEGARLGRELARQADENLSQVTNNHH